MWHYLEHDYTPLENLTYLKSIAKPSTTLVIEIPNFDSMSRRKYGENWAGWHTPRHISLFSPNNIELLLQKGWKVSEINTYGTMDPYLLYWMSEMEQKESHGIRIWKMNFGNLCLECYNLYQKMEEKQVFPRVMTIIATPQ
jgi:hypothetical protein